MKQKIVFLLSLSLSLNAFSQNISYYIDNVSGNDNNSSRTRNTAWKSLEKSNTITFEAGDQTYLGMKSDRLLYFFSCYARVSS